MGGSHSAAVCCTLCAGVTFCSGLLHCCTLCAGVTFCSGLLHFVCRGHILQRSAALCVQGSHSAAVCCAAALCVQGSHSAADCCTLCAGVTFCSGLLRFVCRGHILQRSAALLHFVCRGHILQRSAALCA